MQDQSLRSTTENNVVLEERRAVLSNSIIKCSSTIDVQSAIKISCTSYVEAVIDYSCTTDIQCTCHVEVTASRVDGEHRSTNVKDTTNSDITSGGCTTQIKSGKRCVASDIQSTIGADVTSCTKNSELSSVVRTDEQIRSDIHIFVNGHTT